ncbi:hypothetical protein Angca_007913, partial [Angiostrongylus cantonensis]
AKCENEGYPHPRNCSMCICPSGYGGDLCDQRPPGCGDNFMATGENQTLVYGMAHDSSIGDQYTFCN